MPFTKGHPFYRASDPKVYGSQNRPRKEDYEPVESVPDGLVWKPAPHGARSTNNLTILYSLGNVYKLVRVRATGEVAYFKQRDTNPATPAEQIDAEPQRRQQIRYRTGAQCWFVESGRWFLCEVVERHGPHDGQPSRIVIRSVTGFDADRQTPWGFGELLEFPALPANPLFQRLRPLKDRYQ